MHMYFKFCQAALPWEINLSPEDKSTVLLKQVVDVFI